jgi:hypothetical protein
LTVPARHPHHGRPPDRTFVVTYQSMPRTAASPHDAIAADDRGGGEWTAEDIDVIEPRREYEYRARVFYEASTGLHAAALGYLVAITRARWPGTTRLVLCGGFDEDGMPYVRVDEVHTPGRVLRRDSDGTCADELDTLHDDTFDVRSDLAQAGGFVGRLEIPVAAADRPTAAR